MPRRCEFCGATPPGAARYCPTCGARLPSPGELASDLSAADTLEGRPPDPADLVTATRPACTTRPLRGARALHAGRELGSYRLVRPLGRGGFGEVWEAVNRTTGRSVALKVLTRTPARAPGQVERFRREGRLAASLSHPNCVYVFSAEEIEGYPAIAMELMPGGTLQERVNVDGPIPCRQAVDYALQVLDGLEAAHAAGVIHRDIKPSNCFLGPAGAVRLGDFGLSKTLDVDNDLTAAGSFLGTPAYSSPEQVRGRDVDESSDLYSLGATLYTLLAGAPPFSGDGGAQVLARILSEPPAPLARPGVRVPRGLDQVVMRLLAKDKVKRYPSCRALRTALWPYSSHGLAAGGLGGRLAAVVVDSALVQLAVGLVAGIEYFIHPVTLAHQLAALALTFAYFSSQEWRWGRTLGKRLFGLRVVPLEGGTAEGAAIALRVGLFAAVLYAPVVGLLLASPGASPGELSRRLSFWVVGIALPYLALLATVRRRNGFATLHDLASRTRVMTTAPARASVPDVRADRADTEASARTFDGYSDARVVWATAGESLVVARDPRLGRDVWIHVFPNAAQARTPARLAQDRPGRLHWLGRVPSGDDAWDVYEAPSGVGLVEWVAARGRLPWASLREILLDLAVELDARQPEDEAPRPLSARQVWVDAYGQARLLDFPSRLRAGERESSLRRGWRTLLHQVLLLGCEGRLLDPDELGERTPRVPLPEYARTLVHRICGQGRPPAGPGEVAAELRDLAGRPPELGRLRRLGPLFVTSLPGLFMLFTVTFAALEAPEAVRLSGTLRRAGSALERLVAAGGAEQGASLRLALERLQAHAYSELRLVSERSPNPVAVRVAKEALADVAEGEAASMATLLRERPPTGAELADARRELEALEPSTSLWGLSLGFLLFGIAPLAIPALILAPVTRGGALLALFGMSLQLSDGRRAGRLRSLVRAAVVWIPFVTFQLWQPWAVFHIVFPLVLAVGVGYTLARPERGIPDLVGGTRLVPR